MNEMDMNPLLEALNSAVSEALLSPEEEEKELKLNQKLLGFHSMLKTLASANNKDETQDAPNPEIGSMVGIIEGLIESCQKVLSKEEITNSSKALAVQLLAEIARYSEISRNLLRGENVVRVLTGVLKSNCPTETTVQICRVLGNICYDSDEGRSQITSTPDCLKSIYSLACESKEKKDDPGQRLPVILARFLFNFCHQSPESIMELKKVEFISFITGNILETTTNDAVFNSSLSFLICLVTVDEGLNLLRSDLKVSESVKHILLYSTSPEVTETALELIRYFSEDNVLIRKLSDAGVVETLRSKISESWKRPEFETHRSNACDLFVRILSREDCVKDFYNPSSLKSFYSWLQSDDDPCLTTTAALSLGNYVQNEESAQVLIDMEVPELCISLLTSHQSKSKEDVKLQHALLGCIRNLAVCPSGKKKLEELNVLEPCLSLISKISIVFTPSVVFQLLSVFRLISDGSSDVSSRLINDRPALENIVEWGNAENSVFKSEVGRLLASAIKHSKSSSVMESIVSAQGLPHLSALLLSQHTKMLNEGLIAFILMAASLDNRTIIEQMYTDFLINRLKEGFSSDNLPIEVKKNQLTLVSTLYKADPESFKRLCTDLNFLDSLNHESIKYLEETKLILKLFSS